MSASLQFFSDQRPLIYRLGFFPFFHTAYERIERQLLPEKPTVNAIFNNYYFAVKKDGFKPLSKTLLSFKIVGVPLVQPIKLRPGKGSEGWNLGGEFTVSYNFGLRLKLGNNPFKQNFVSLVPFGFGVGAAKYFKDNGDGTLSEKSDSYAVTYYQGGSFLPYRK